MQNEQSPSREAVIDAIRSGFMTSVSGDGSYRIEIKYPTLPALQAAHSAILALLTPPTPQPDADREAKAREVLADEVSRMNRPITAEAIRKGLSGDYMEAAAIRAMLAFADATHPQPSPAIPGEFDPIEFGRRVADHVEALGISYREAAEQAGMNHATLNRISRGGMPDLMSYFAVTKWMLATRPQGSDEADRCGWCKYFPDSERCDCDTPGPQPSPAIPEGGTDLGEPVTLNECPPGLFMFNGHMGFKTEYTTTLENPRRYQVDAFVVKSGEYFWGGAKGTDQRGKLIVQPISLAYTPKPAPQPVEDVAELVEALDALEFANDRLCSVRLQAAYDQMIADGNEQFLEDLDVARRNAREILSRLRQKGGEANG